ncbi:putative CBL-interacting protein kinase 13 [Hordeum vulgare]|nr:putative CBL-interacting protein kinase 13 [Hordeum vulgare]
MECTEWSGLALNHPARCEHRAPCEKFVAFRSTHSGRRFLGCAKKDGPKCKYVQRIDSEWPIPWKQALAAIWDMYDKECDDRLRQNVFNAEEVFKNDRHQEKLEKVKLLQEMDQIKKERGILLEEREKLKQEKRYLKYTIVDLFGEKEASKGKIRKIKEIIDE